MLVAIAACEIGFWVLLGAGLLLRYVLLLRKASTIVLVALPLVDLALVAFTIIDLRRGAAPDGAHALAAVYLGFSIAFGADIVGWADVRVAHRFAGGPPPPPKPESGTSERVRKEWRDWRLALVAFVLTSALLVIMALLATSNSGKAPLFGPVPGLATVLVVWLLGWPVTESRRARRRQHSVAVDRESVDR